MNEPTQAQLHSSLTEGQKALSYPLDKLQADREGVIARLKEASAIVDSGVKVLSPEEFHFYKNTLSYLLWRLNLHFNNDEAEQFSHRFLEFSRLVELDSIKAIQDMESELKKEKSQIPEADAKKAIAEKRLLLQACYLSQAEVCIWLSQYYASDVKQWVTYFYRAQLRVLLMEEIASTLDGLQTEQLAGVKYGIESTQILIIAQMGELKALDIFRLEFLSDIDSLSDEVMDKFTEEKSRRINLLYTLEDFCAFYKDAQSTAATTHKAWADKRNRNYYRELVTRKLHALFIAIESQHVKERTAVQNQDLFGLVESLQIQDKILLEILEIFNQLKKKFGLTSAGLELLVGDDFDKLTDALKSDELRNDFLYNLNRSRSYEHQLEIGKNDLSQLIEVSRDDIHRHYYAQLYNYFERLFLACKTISSGLIQQTHQGTVGKVGSFLGVISGPIGQIPVAGTAISAALQVIGKVAEKVDYDRTVNTFKTFDQVFAAETLKYLANYLACELVKTHFYQLPNILLVSDTVVGKTKRKVVGEMQPNIFDRVSEYFCARVFAIIMDNVRLNDLLKEANRSVNFKGHRVNFVHRVGNVILDELSHYQQQGVMGAINNFLLKSHEVRWQDPFDVNKQTQQSLHDIFGKAHVRTASPKTYRHKKSGEAATVARFGFIQSSHERVLARADSLEDVTQQQGGPDWQTFNPLHAGEVSFPALYEQLRRQGEIITDLTQRLEALERQGAQPNNNNRAGQ